MKSFSTQSLIPVDEIKDGVLLREDGFYCAVVLVNAINFELKSVDERQSILFRFQDLLNSLEIGIQIVVQSRKFNIQPYLKYLQELYTKQQNELLKLQTKEYINFIDSFNSRNNIMSKQFYVVVQYSPVITNTKNIIFGKGVEDADLFEQNKVQLIQRVSFLQNNIRALGIRSIMLGTEELTELLYKAYNPADVGMSGKF